MSKIHIPIGDRMVCGSTSLASYMSSRNLCSKCLKSIEVILIKHGYLVVIDPCTCPNPTEAYIHGHDPSCPQSAEGKARAK